MYTASTTITPPIAPIRRKNDDHINRCEDPHVIHHRIGLCPYGWCVAEVQDIVYVTPYPGEATTQDSDVNIRLKSEVATYGYDGLDAYELAVVKGKTTKSEGEWVSVCRW